MIADTDAPRKRKRRDFAQASGLVPSSGRGDPKTLHAIVSLARGGTSAGLARNVKCRECMMIRDAAGENRAP